MVQEGALNESSDSNKRHTMKGDKEGNRRVTKSLRYAFQPKSYKITLFVASYLAIWALTGIVLLVGWSILLDTLLL